MQRGKAIARRRFETPAAAISKAVWSGLCMKNRGRGAAEGLDDSQKQRLIAIGIRTIEDIPCDLQRCCVRTRHGVDSS
jgi:hypothetical protein